VGRVVTNHADAVGQAGAPNTIAQALAPFIITLDGDDVCASRRAGERQRARARSEVDDQIAGDDICDESLDGAGISDEVLLVGTSSLVTRRAARAHGAAPP
jgi:hypothetical protein